MLMGTTPYTLSVRRAQVRLPYHIRMLVPCYREELEIVQRTVLAALHADGHQTLNPCDAPRQVTLPYHIRVLVPCYREELEIVQRTVLAALDADLPAGCARTVYLCDDGKVRGLATVTHHCVDALTQQACTPFGKVRAPWATSPIWTGMQWKEFRPC